MAKKGLVFDIQRFSVHDGPGIRTLVFLKGCPLRCRWCSNPESQQSVKQLMFVERNCIHCKQCIMACPQNALSFTPAFHLDETKCKKCGKCVDVCYSGALEMVGCEQDVEEVMQELEKDQLHYRKSGGGITLSGGEPLAQPDYCKKLLMACKARGWHTAIETTAFTSGTVLEEVLPWLDLVLLDIKHTDDLKHQQFIGQSNQVILKNAQFISSFGVPIIVRVPVIPTFNDTAEEIGDIADFSSSINGVKELHLLPYHRLGENKYRYLQYPYQLKDVSPPSLDKMKNLQKVVERKGLICKIGG
ncbi:glycyl-radical enzyme activating protein [Bacillaceae bacterium Marseille-Q3522]|nr:glycyl-radical enzyme activating protein [Bacillaceae bacterium Marseille-Q3522]